MSSQETGPATTPRSASGRSPSLAAPAVGDFAILQCPLSELSLQHTLASGQAFRWQRDRQGWWSAVIQSEPTPIILRCWQDREQLYYQTYPRANNLTAVSTYFQLDVDLPALEIGWRRAAGQEIASGLDHFAGLRVTMQDPVECLFSFLCSSVAPIYRIRRGIDAMCRTLGARIGEVGGQEHFAFPPLEYMADANRDLYDKMGLGFRGGNVKESAKELIARGGRDYLLTLRAMPYAEAQAQLVSLPGVGAKIADCVCLFSLAKQEAVPLDVHVTRVAKRLFSEARAYNSLTGRAYAAIAELFRRRFGPYAGWAQQYLFYNELLSTGAWDEQMGTHVPATKRLAKP